MIKIETKSKIQYLFYNKVALRITLIYMALSVIWILFSDKLLLTDPQTAIYISTIKGWVYTLIVGIFFYITITRELNKRMQVEIERKKVEDFLVASENKYKVLVDLAVDGIILGSHDGIITEVNKQMCDILGMNKEDLIGKHIKFLPFTKESLAANPLRFDLLQKGEIVKSERTILRPDGKEVYIEMRSKMMPDGTYQSICQDITERKIIQDNLKIAEQKFRRLFEAAKDSILILDANTGQIIDSNPFIQDLLGYSAKELIGSKIYEISPFKDIIENKEKFLELQDKGYVYYDNLPLKTKSGIVKQIEFVSNVYLVADKKVIQCNIRDITERIKKEKELEVAKSDFLSMTSHQLRTPLSATKWVLEAIAYDKNLTPKQQERFGYLVDSNERLINLVNDLLDVTRIESGKLQVNKKIIDINKLINNLFSSFEFLISKGNKNIIIKIPDGLKDIYCDPVLIYEALKNLLNNAIIYGATDSKDIILSVIERDEDYLISIHNDGYINSDAILKIKDFQKFTRGIGASEIQPAGSGLGLYITKKVIEASGGNVWFESSAEHGTTFYLTIIKSKL